MNELTFALLSEGSSDRALLPLLIWLLEQHFPDFAIQGEWADLRRLPIQKRSKLSDRIRLAIDLYPSEVLFIHRDADRETLELRENEIVAACDELKGELTLPATISVIPIRMSEAWLLIDAPAIRTAANNPRGITPLDLPQIERLEALPDPKDVLFKLLREASEMRGRRLAKFDPHAAVFNVAGGIRDFTVLRRLKAFRYLEDQVVGLRATL